MIQDFKQTTVASGPCTAPAAVAVARYTTAITTLSLSLLTDGWLEPGRPPSLLLLLLLLYL